MNTSPSIFRLGEKYEPHPWTLDDIRAGRLVCKYPEHGIGGWFAKWSYQIGYSFGNSGWPFNLISMADGMTHERKTKDEILDWLIKNEMVPMRREWLILMIDEIPLTLGLQ